MMKKLIARAAALCLILSCLLGCFTAQAAAAVSKDAALKTAQAEVSSKAVLRESEWDEEDGEWEFEFRTKDKKTTYDVTVDGSSGALRKVEMEKKSSKAKKYAVSKKDAKKTVKKAFSGAKNLKVKKKTDDGSKIYVVTFCTDSYKGKAEVNGKTGKIIEWKKSF